MSSSDHGDVLSSSADTSKSREALFCRLAERHAQVKSSFLSRKNDNSGELSSNGLGAKSSKQIDFLPKLLGTKAEILSDLDQALERKQKDELSVTDLTKVLDDTLARVEELQRRLNEYSLYLTPFDREQSNLELKNLQTQFQLKREELLPSKKFAFSRKRVQTTTNKPSAAPFSQEKVESTKPISSALTAFDERFSLTNVENKDNLELPKAGCSETIGPDQSVYLAELRRCTIRVRDVCGSLIARGLHHCLVYAYPVAGSVWVEDCHHCDFIVACRQLRIHQTTDCRLGLHMASRPIIEHSTGLQVGPYPLHYPELESDLTRCGLLSDVNLWREVEDFSHPNKRLTSGSPNWSILPEKEWDSLKPA